MSEQQPKVQLFREKSLEAVESPESLNDYLRVTSPGIWLVMAVVIILLVGGILWGIFGHIRTTEAFAVSVRSAVLGSGRPNDVTIVPTSLRKNGNMHSTQQTPKVLMTVCCMPMRLPQ